MLQFLAELVTSLLILAGSFFLFVGSLGLARLPSLMQRLHASGPAAQVQLRLLLKRDVGRAGSGICEQFLELSRAAGKQIDHLLTGPRLLAGSTGFRAPFVLG